MSSSVRQTVNVANNASASVTNTATVAGGNEVNTGNDTGSDPTTINPGSDLTISKSHTGNFFHGQTVASYIIRVPKSASLFPYTTLFRSDVLPTGLTATGFSGTNWIIDSST